MCLLVVHFQPGQSPSVLLGANRDEFLSRPTTSLTVLKSASPRILGGRDEKAGGTWLAVNEWGVAAALTNQPSVPDPKKQSRGQLPLFLASFASAKQAVEAFAKEFRAQQTNPCWLLVVDRNQLFSIDMTQPETVPIEELAPGWHILENRPLSENSVKQRHIRRLLNNALETYESPDLALKRLLASHDWPEDWQTEAPQVFERPKEAFAACVHPSSVYGTRSSAVVTLGDDIRFELCETSPCRGDYVDRSELWRA